MDQVLAPCGLSCSECDIFRAPQEPEIAQRITAYFEQRGLGVKPEQIRCSGCPGNREEHWSPDCSILQCVVDERQLRYCSECHEFACERLEQWADGSERYGLALERLRKLSRNNG